MLDNYDESGLLRINECYGCAVRDIVIGRCYLNWQVLWKILIEKGALHARAFLGW